LLGYANRGRLYVSKDSRGYQDTDTIILTSDLEYATATDYIAIETVIYTNADGVKKALVKDSPKNVGRVDDPGEPVYWYEWDGKVGVFPVLATPTGETVTVYLVPLPADLELRSTLDTPHILDLALEYFIASQALVKEKKYTASAHMLAMCDDEVKKARLDLAGEAR
jgi:hypothetical protein